MSFRCINLEKEDHCKMFCLPWYLDMKIGVLTYKNMIGHHEKEYLYEASDYYNEIIYG